MYWNNRVVRFVDVIEGETEEFYEIKEVYYDGNDKPYGYGGPCLGSESVESLREVVARLHEAFDNPVLDAKNFLQFSANSSRVSLLIALPPFQTI